MRLTAAITKENGLFVAQCLEVDVASQGETIDAALGNLREALELHFSGGANETPRPSPIIAPIDIVVSR